MESASNNYTRKCTNCKQEKNISCFALRYNQKGHQSYCKACGLKFKTNGTTLKKLEVVRYLGDRCKKCGIKHNGKNTVIFDFHHKKPSDKVADWTIMRFWTMERIHKEISKCMLLCSNCHRMQHLREIRTKPLSF